jgi:molybdenum cofactor cytidylyltransferase
MINSELSRLRIVVLAAGFSTRMGRSKAFTKIRGVSLIRRTIAVLAPFAVQTIVVVTAPRARRIRVELRGQPVSFIANPERSLGLSTSVVRGLRAARTSGATLLLPMDLAELKPREVARLIMRWCTAKRRVTARRLGDRSSTPLILPRWLYPRARGIIGDVGLRELLAGMPTECRTLVELPSATRDVDTPEELSAARRRAGPPSAPRMNFRSRYIRRDTAR